MSDQSPPQYPSYPTGGGQSATPPAHGTPPPAYGTQPPQSYGLGQPGPTAPYASWWSRVGAYLLDGLIALAVIIIPLVAGLIIALKDAELDVDGNITGGVDAVGVAVILLTGLLFFAFDIWNRGIRLGVSGQSLGKGILGIQAVRADTGAFLGGGGGLLRWLMAAMFGVITCVQFLDVLWPLWDDKNQTLHDKVVGSVVIRK